MTQHFKRILAAALFCVSGLAGAQNLEVLSDAQLDSVSAGGQYSMVYGAASAENGAVWVDAQAQTVVRRNGATATRATLKLEAEGAGLAGIGIGESVADDAYSAGYAEAYTDQGQLKIRIRTMSRINPNGKAISKTVVHVKATGNGATTYKALF